VDETELALMIATGSQPVSAQSQEPPVAIPPMPDGGEVVSDYRSVGLTLRQHPVSFVGEELTRLGAIPFARLSDVRPGRRIWPKMFERQRRILLSASMIARRGLLQRESDVTHVVAEQLTDLSNAGQHWTPRVAVPDRTWARRPGDTWWRTGSPRVVRSQAT
jgi:error-prone DNA polymerase